MTENKELENLEDLLKLKTKDLKKNKFLEEKFRRNFSYASNLKFSIFGINYIEEKNLIKKISKILFFEKKEISKLNLFLKFFLNSKKNLNEISFKNEKSYKNMIINVFIFITNFTHLLIYSKNFYKNWKKSEILFNCFHILNTLLNLLNKKFLSFKKISNTNFIKSIILLINFYTDFLSQKKNSIFQNFQNFEKKNISKTIKNSLVKLDKIFFQKFEIETILIGFLETSFLGVNNYNILKFFLKSVNKLKKNNFVLFLQFLRKKYNRRTSINNYLYNNSISNLFLKFSHFSDFLGFFLNIIFNLPLNLFVCIENDVYIFLDKILENYNIEVFKKFQNYFTGLIRESVEFLDRLREEQEKEKLDNKIVTEGLNEELDTKIVTEGLNEKLEVKNNLEKKNLKKTKKTEKTVKKAINPKPVTKTTSSYNSFKEFKKILYTISFLERVLCNPIFKSYFVYEKKSDILLNLEKKLNLIKIPNFEDSKKFLLQIRKKILNSLIFCIDYNFGIRSLLKKKKIQIKKKI